MLCCAGEVCGCVIAAEDCETDSLPVGVAPTPCCDAGAGADCDAETLTGETTAGCDPCTGATDCRLYAGALCGVTLPR